ncbi:MAG: DUF4870 domain-containing protein [Bacteroidetes bacterium]|nr:DUF4870 domain-containing protein [Bacteroidota bacterium]
MEPTGKSSTGLDENVAGLICYLGLIGLIFFLIEKQSRLVKFHGLQSTLLWAIVFGVYLVVRWIPFIGWLIALVIYLGALCLMILLMIKAYNNEMFKLPFIGDIAERQAVIG